MSQINKSAGGVPAERISYEKGIEESSSFSDGRGNDDCPVMTASAETVVSGGTYQITFPDRNNSGERLPSAVYQVIVSDVPLRTDVTDQYHQKEVAAEAKAGYEMKGVYFYYPNALYVPDFWSAHADGSGIWTPTQNFSEYGIEYGGLGKIYTFTVNMNGRIIRTVHCIWILIRMMIIQDMVIIQGVMQHYACQLGIQAMHIFSFMIIMSRVLQQGIHLIIISVEMAKRQFQQHLPHYGNRTLMAGG